MLHFKKFHKNKKRLMETVTPDPQKTIKEAAALATALSNLQTLMKSITSPDLIKEVTTFLQQSNIKQVTAKLNAIGQQVQQQNQQPQQQQNQQPQQQQNQQQTQQKNQQQQNQQPQQQQNQQQTQQKNSVPKT